MNYKRLFLVVATMSVVALTLVSRSSAGCVITKTVTRTTTSLANACSATWSKNNGTCKKYIHPANSACVFFVYFSSTATDTETCDCGTGGAGTALDCDDYGECEERVTAMGGGGAQTNKAHIQWPTLIACNSLPPDAASDIAAWVGGGSIVARDTNWYCFCSDDQPPVVNCHAVP
jgi:hypothetical protein